MAAPGTLPPAQRVRSVKIRRACRRRQRSTVASAGRRSAARHCAGPSRPKLASISGASGGPYAGRSAGHGAPGAVPRRSLAHAGDERATCCTPGGAACAVPRRCPRLSRRAGALRKACALSCTGTQLRHSLAANFGLEAGLALTQTLLIGIRSTLTTAIDHSYTPCQGFLDIQTYC